MVTVNKKDLLSRIRMAQVASCECLTKPPFWDAHEPECLFRVLREAEYVISKNYHEDTFQIPSELPDLTSYTKDIIVDP